MIRYDFKKYMQNIDLKGRQLALPIHEAFIFEQKIELKQSMKKQNTALFSKVLSPTDD